MGQPWGTNRAHFTTRVHVNALMAEGVNGAGNVKPTHFDLILAKYYYEALRLFWLQFPCPMALPVLFLVPGLIFICTVVVMKIFFTYASAT